MAHPTPKAKAVTILDSFNNPLPYFERKEGLGVSTHYSSTKVADQDPPKFWLHRKVAKIIENCGPAIEPTIFFSSEADVEHASFLYLLNGVNIALAAMFPKDSIICLSQPSQGGTRPDIVFQKNRETFAVLEHKVVGTFSEAEFKRAQVPMEWSPEKISKRKATAERQHKRTYFVGKSLRVVKQLTLYATCGLWDTDYVASFNWDWRFLAIFNSTNEVIHGTFVPRTGTGGNALRKALFGWLYEACTNNGQSHLTI